jgi:hypothetical protein
MRFGFLLLALLPLLALIAAGQTPPKAPVPAVGPDPDPLALTKDEIKDLKIADLEMANARMEQALLKARFKDLGDQIDQMAQSRAALQAGIIAARKLPAGARIDLQTMRIVPAPPTPPAAPPTK